ncbi:transcriptional regulator PpsR [Gemmatimonadetes bacterium T265]|nr:transcriptional regulator PpsR [Gemmatimonadetes bacterium T265]
MRNGRPFGLPGRAALTRLGGDGAAALLSAHDLAVVVDAAGIVVDVAAGVGTAARAAAADAGYADAVEGWVGRRWVDTVTSESRGKIELLLREAAPAGLTPRRQVNHVAPDGHDFPVAYTAVRLSDGGVVAAGRDMRATAALQQRLVETQQALERDYWQLRHVQTRYRLLFERSAEAVLVVDAATRKVVDANPAARDVFGPNADRLVGRAFPPEMAAPSRQALDDLLVATRLDARGDDIEVALADGRRLRAAASCLRQDAQTLFLVRFGEAEGATPREAGGRWAGQSLDALLDAAPDAFVVTDADGQVIVANRAFLDLAQLSDAAQAEGHSLAEWVGRPGADLPVLLTMLRQHGVLRLVGTSVRGEHGTATDVELSAVRAPDGASAGPAAMAWTIRDVGRRVGGGTGGARDLTRAVEQLTGLVGKVSLPDLVRDTIEMVERHFIEAALDLTRDNRTAAAEVLGLSRQSLYLKLRRHRLLPAEPADADSSG